MKNQGLLVFVFRNGNQDTTNNGLTNKHDQLRMVGDNVEGPFPPKEDEDYLILEKRNFRGEEFYVAIPASLKESGKWTMFGGNFVYSSDSRFPSDAPIKVHDRVEEWGD